MTTVKTQVLINILGVSKASLTGWRKAGAPGYVRRDTWDLKIFLPWWAENIFGNTVDDDPTIQDAKRRYWLARACREELKADVEKGELMRKDAVSTRWAARVTELTQGLNMLQNRLPPVLEGKTRGEMHAIVADEIHRLRDQYAREGRYCPPPDNEAWQ